MRAEAMSPAQAPLSHLTSLTKHKVKYKIIKDIKTAMAEHKIPSVGPFGAQGPVQEPWLRSQKPALEGGNEII